MAMIEYTRAIVRFMFGRLKQVPPSDRLVGPKQQGIYVLRAIWLFASVFVLLPDSASSHGNVTIAQDICVREVGGSVVHFNAYQPQHEQRGQYCTEIPREGDTFLVVDLIDPGLRHRPVGVRVVRGVNEAAEEETVAYWPPVIHPDGVVRGEATLVKGLYKLVILPEGIRPSSYELRVQQTDYMAVVRNHIVPITIIVLFVLMGREFSKVRRSINWRVSGHT